MGRQRPRRHRSQLTGQTWQAGVERGAEATAANQAWQTPSQTVHLSHSLQLKETEEPRQK